MSSAERGSTPGHHTGPASNPLNSDESTLVMPSQDSNSAFRRTPIHVTENQVHDAANHYQLQEDSLFLNQQTPQPSSYQSKKILKIDNTGYYRILPRCLRFAFADHEFELLYREYYENEKRTDFKTLIVIIFIVNLSFLSARLLSLERQNRELMLTLLVIAISLIIIFVLVRRRLADNQRKLSAQLSRSNQKKHLPNQRNKCQQFVYACFKLFSLDNLIWLMMPYLIWFLILFEIFIDLIYFKSNQFSPCDALSSLLLFTYAMYVVFPLRLRIASTLAVLTAVFYLTLQLTKQTLAKNGELKLRLLFADLFLILSANLIGLMSYFFYEKRQRRAFLETCTSLENKLDEEEESQEQERLLLSVLPKHVVNNIREDLGSVINKPFKKIYMVRHEEVSILFADIVGFTAISSTLPAPKLVKILNELFARFDKLSEKYHQLRIKILGDCYYCISGAPDKRPDHAVLCVHMGLSMCDVIKSVRDQTNSKVDMRVGIHTGAVLAGVLGQKQWQFDVYSKDVELANKMESGGLPGKVHISEETVKFLNGEFELEDGQGHTREETIRSSGIRTYLIVKVLKPYPEGTLDEKLGNQSEFGESNVEQQKLLMNDANQTTVNDTNNNNNNNSTNNDVQRKVSNAIARASITGQHTTTVVADRAYSAATSHSSINQLDQSIDEYQRRLRFELLNRDNIPMTERIRPFTFSFSDKTYEHEYMNNSDETAGVSLTGLPITALFTALAEFTLGVTSFTSAIVLASSCIALSFLASLSTVSSWVGRRYSYTNEASFERDSLDLEALDPSKRPSNEQISMREMKAGVNEKSPLKNGDHALNSNNTNNTKLTVSPHKSRQLSRHSSASRKSVFNKYRLSDERILLPNCLPRPLLAISLAVQHNALVRLVVYVLMIAIWLSTSVMINLDYQQQTKLPHLLPATTGNRTNDPVDSLTSTDRASLVDSVVEQQSKNPKLIKSLYLTYYVVLLLLAISALKRMSLLLKMLFIFGCTILQSAMNFVFHKPLMDKLDRDWYGILLDSDGHLIYLTIQLLAVTVACFILNQQFELMSRRLFLWQMEVEEQKKKVKMMKNKNEKLLYNILPPHVACHFLGRKKRDEELYSKSYNSVGVLFAAVPNFTDFYTEESVNNQGLECLRFLNEVISDFDGLLDQERFHNISKIKTISSTYMAASGLNSEIDIDDEETDLKIRWAHLADLTHFALELKETLDNINKESFNNFVLKIGINHGNITAGVIGSRIHFDIWGNTVNVASRMESTGKAGCIQVTEETSKILQLFDFKFEPRGQVAVKGKGKLMTYYLVNPTK